MFFFCTVSALDCVCVCSVTVSVPRAQIRVSLCQYRGFIQSRVRHAGLKGNATVRGRMCVECPDTPDYIYGMHLHVYILKIDD